MPREIHFRGGVDGFHVRILCNNPRVVGIFDIPHQHVRVVVDKRIYVMRAEKERCYHLSRVNLFTLAVDDS